MRVRLGIADSARVIEIEVDEAETFEAKVAAFFKGGDPLLWVVDSKNHRVGIPRDKLTFVEIEPPEEKPKVGFGG